MISECANKETSKLEVKKKKEKWDLMKEPNMALREIRDIRPHLVLERHIVSKTYLRGRVRGES